MNKKVLFALIMAFGIFGLAACSNDDDVTDEPCSTAWSTEIQAEIEGMSLAAQTYASDPTPANCEAYRSAAQAYIDALKPYGNCATLTGQSRVQWEEAVAEAEADIAEMDCS